MENEEAHRHRWVLGGSPGVHMYRGKCRRCGAERTFTGGVGEVKGGTLRSWNKRRSVRVKEEAKSLA